MYLALERYSRPTSVEECLRLLHAGERAALLSGGTDLNARGHEALTHVIDVQALPLASIAVEGGAAGAVRIGARVTLSRLRRDPALQGPAFAALREAAAGYAIVALQNRSTLGGRIATDRSDQDVPTALLALDARVKLARLVDGKLQESVVDYPVGVQGRAALAGALIVDVVLPAGEGRSALRRFGRTAVDVPLATCAASLRDGRVRIAANVQGPSAADLRRLPRAEALASSWAKARPEDWRKQVRAVLCEELAAWEDPWASGDYRQDLSATMAVRALAAVFGEPEIQ